MAKKKKKQMRETLYCPYCKRPGVLRPAAYVYGDNNLDPEKYLYVCSGYPSCDSYIGAHISGNFLITCVNRPSGNVQTI